VRGAGRPGSAPTRSDAPACNTAVGSHSPAPTQGAARSLFGLQLLRQQLPPERAIEIYLNTIPAFRSPIVSALLTSQGFTPNLPANLPPIAAGVAFRDNAVHAGAFISTQNIKNLFDLYQALSQ